MNELKEVWESKLKIRHFIVSFVITCLLTYGIFVLSFLFAWLCCMEFAERFSWLTILGVFSTVLIIILLIIYMFYYYAKRKRRLRFCKSYVILSIILIIAYLIITPWFIIIN